MITLFAALALFAAPADPPAIAVAYADLDLTSAAGTAELDRRIGRAIDAICPAANPKALVEVQAERKCRAHAANQAAMRRAAVRGR